MITFVETNGPKEERKTDLGFSEKKPKKKTENRSRVSEKKPKRKTEKKTEKKRNGSFKKNRTGERKRGAARGYLRRRRREIGRAHV